MQKEDRRDSVDITQESTAAELESSFVEEGEEINPAQSKMLIVFQLLQLFHTVLTISLGPLYPLIQLHYGISSSKVRLLYSSSLLACLIAFYPTNSIIGRYGIKTGLVVCLIGALLGGVLCCLINLSFTLFLVGYFIMQFFMQSIHSAKGHFVNLYFVENQVSQNISSFKFFQKLKKTLKFLFSCIN